MGLLRLLLAYSVLVGHSGGLPGLTADNGVSLVLTVGDTAVQTFYLISGFYITIVWNRKYSLLPHSVREFWIARYLRLAPLYILVSLATAATFYAVSGSLPLYGEADFLDAAFALLSNLTLIGQDVFMFVAYNLTTQSFVFMPDILQGGLAAAGPEFEPGWGFLMIAQGWSIGVEMWFYILAPFLLHRSIVTVAAVLAGSFALRIAVFELVGWDDDPWDYRFFPFELGVFLIGSLAGRLYMSDRFIFKHRRAGLAVLTVILGLVILYPLFPGGGSEKRWILIGFVALAIPTLFHLTQNWRVDRWIGELSYPVYIVHMLVLMWLPGDGHGTWRGIACLIASTALSALLVWAVEERVDRYRAARFRKQSISGT